MLISGKAESKWEISVRIIYIFMSDIISSKIFLKILWKKKKTGLNNQSGCTNSYLNTDRYGI